MASAPSGQSFRWQMVWRGPPANRGQMVTDLSDARSRKLHFDLFAPATAECAIDGRSPQVAAIQELSQDLVVSRWNTSLGGGMYETFFRGPIGHSQDTISETTHTVNLQAADYRAILARSALLQPLTFSQVDQAEIARQLCLPYQTTTGLPYYSYSADQGVSWGGVKNPDGTNRPGNTGVLRDRTYQGTEQVGAMIDNLSQVINGFDWGCEPRAPGATTAGTTADAYVWYPQRGISKSFVAEWGATVASLSRTVESTTFANWVRFTGAQGVTPAVSTGDQWVNPQLHPEGLWQETDTGSADVSQAATLQQQADGRLAIASVLVPSYSLVLAPGAWAQKSDCWLGDTIGVRVNSGRLAVDTTVRIVQVDFDISDQGTEKISLTVARPAPSLGRVIARQQDQLDALSRR